jgi:hypothetical protein
MLPVSKDPDGHHEAGMAVGGELSDWYCGGRPGIKAHSNMRRIVENQRYIEVPCATHLQYQSLLSCLISSVSANSRMLVW